MPDHIHMLMSVPPQLAPAKLVQYLKGRSSRMLQDEFPQLKKRYWASLCGRGVPLRKRGCGGRGHHPTVHRKPAVGRSGRELLDHRAHRAISRLLAGHLTGGFSRNPTYRLQPVVV
ncbi:transposase [Edaphobacter modestus]|uniref:transposase n=1 Tax=Edaphobacter modestus TaxID=388466 RepID=UPI003BF7F116